MSIDKRLKEIYTRNKKVITYDAVVFYHPYFDTVKSNYTTIFNQPGDDLNSIQPVIDAIVDSSYFFVSDTKSHEFIYNDKIYNFQPMIMKAQLPDVSDKQQDLKLIFPYLGFGMKRFFDVIQNDQRRLEVTFLTYIDNETVIQEPAAQFPPVYVNSITVNPTSVQFLCSRTDLYDTFFLSEVFDQRFKGLML